MTILNLAASSDTANHGKAQICIIGAGMAGLFIARHLAKSGVKVLVLESGTMGFDQQTHDLNTIVDVHGHYSRALSGRYRGLGGSSSQWGGRMIPVIAHDIEPRPYLGLEGWPIAFDALENVAPEIEDAFGLPHGTYGADALGNSATSDVFPAHNDDFTCRWPKWINLRQCNLATLWKHELRALPGLEIWLGATVKDFTLDTERGQLKTVTAGHFNGNTIKIEADQFVIAAGTIETTRLLLWLDAQSQHRAFESCTALGRYFQDHLKAGVATISRHNQALTNRLFGYHFANGTRRSLHLDLTPAAQEEEEVTSAFVYAAMDMTQSRLQQIKTVARGLQNRQTSLRDIAGLAHDIPLVARSIYSRYAQKQIYMPPDVMLDVQIAVEQAPRWDNYIALSRTERDRFGLPLAALRWQPRPSEERTFRATLARLARYWHDTNLANQCPLDFTIGQPGDDRAVIDTAEAYAHPSGSTRMGLDPKRSVVGPDLTCHAIPNLSVASASTFPTSGSANPTLTILKLALRLADKLALLASPRAATHFSPKGLSTSLVPSPTHYLKN